MSLKTAGSVAELVGPVRPRVHLELVEDRRRMVEALGGQLLAPRGDVGKAQLAQHEQDGLQVRLAEERRVLEGIAQVVVRLRVLLAAPLADEVGEVLPLRRAGQPDVVAQRVDEHADLRDRSSRAGCAPG